MFSKSLLVVGVLLAPAVLANFGAAPTPPPLLRKRKDDIECDVARYKLETANPPPETPTAVMELAEATPTFLDEEGYFNVTDACEGPTSVSGAAGEALTSYMEAASSWTAEHACALESIYNACTGAARYSSLHLNPSVYCTKLTEEATKESECPSAGVALRGAGAAAAVLAGAVVALVGF